MLAGWGSTSSPAASGRRCGGAVALAAVAAIFCVPFVWMLAAGTIAPGHTQAALKVAWGFRDPPAAGTRGRRWSGTPTARDRPPERAAPVAPARRRGSGAHRAAPGRRAAARTAPGRRVRRSGRGGAGGRPVPGQHGLQPRDPDRPRAPSPRPRRSATSSRAGRTASPGSGRPARCSRSSQTSRCATGCTTRADTTIRSSAATTASGAPPPGPTRTSSRPTTLAQPTARVAARAEPAQRHRRHPGARPSRSAQAARPPARSRRRPDARMYRNANALPRAFLVDRQQTVAGDDAALSAATSGAVDARHVAVTAVAPGGLPQDDGTPAAGVGSARLAALRTRARAWSRSMRRGARCSCSPTSTTRAGRRRSTAVTRRSSASTTCCAACGCRPGRTRSSSATSPRAGALGWIVSLRGRRGGGAGLALFGWRAAAADRDARRRGCALDGAPARRRPRR